MPIQHIFGNAEEGVVKQLEACITAEEGSVGVLCADNHLGYSMPIGGVIAYAAHISPSAVGYDIACGNKAARTSVHITDLKRDLPRVMDEIWKQLSFGIGRKNNERAEHEVLDRIAGHDLPVIRDGAAKAAAQLGTIGSGNHYVDLLVDESGYVWVGVHFGSRGFGHGVATWAMEQACGGKVPNDMNAPPIMIDWHSDLGADYWEAMTVAGAYAYAGRDWVVDKVVRDILQTHANDSVHNHHNFAWVEQGLFIHRKGATPAYPGQRGFVGGSMGDISVIISGVESPESYASLYSAMHGAGRVMSRKKAAGKIKPRKFWMCGRRACNYKAPINAHSRGKGGERPPCPECWMVEQGRLMENVETEVVTPGCVDYDAWLTTLAARGIEIRGGGADEAPPCYKPLKDVLFAHRGTIEIEHILQPVGVAMAGKDTVDPYKD